MASAPEARRSPRPVLLSPLPSPGGGDRGRREVQELRRRRTRGRQQRRLPSVCGRGMSRCAVSRESICAAAAAAPPPSDAFPRPRRTRLVQIVHVEKTAPTSLLAMRIYPDESFLAGGARTYDGMGMVDSPLFRLVVGYKTNAGSRGTHTVEWRGGVSVEEEKSTHVPVVRSRWQAESVVGIRTERIPHVTSRSVRS
mmetsp:Transcript_1305/g.3551  ORF Transcript_1305/g.3551 Transcript_1305/m.3551 type:complete len:197 (-) Transcript_1305:71-661(-)